MLVSIAVLSLAPDNELAEENHWNEKNPPPWNGNERLSISNWHGSASGRTGPSGEIFPRPLVFFFGDLVVGPVVVETQEKLTVERRKVSENHAVPIQKKDLTESPFDYAQQSSSSQKRTIAMTSKNLPQLSWSSTQKNSKTSLKCMKLRRLQIPPTTELVINTKKKKTQRHL